MKHQYNPAPQKWTDHHGRVWRVSTARHLSTSNPGHVALREFVLHRDHAKCKDCGCTDLSQLVPDHIVSRRNGGTHHPNNIQCLCKSCNSRKAGCIDSKVGRSRSLRGGFR